MTWLIYSLLTVVLFTAWSLIARIATVKSDNPRAFSFIYNILAVLFGVLLFAIPQENPLPLTIPVIALTIVMTLVYGIYGRAQFYATKHVEASTLSIIGKVAPLITFTLSIMIFRESASLIKWLAAFFILGGNVIALYDKTGLRVREGLGYALISAVSAGLGWTLDKYLIDYYPLALYVVISYGTTAFYTAIAPTLKKADIIREAKQGFLKILLIAFCGGIGYFFQLKALSVGEASRAIMVISTSSVFTILLGIVLLKETANIKRKILAGILVFIGIVLLG